MKNPAPEDGSHWFLSGVDKSAAPLKRELRLSFAVMSSLSGPLLLTNQFLQFLEKSTEMEAIADSVVDLHRQWDTADPVTLIILSESKDRQEVVITFLQIQIEAVKRGPWNH